ncbi:PIN domain-containing protein [Allomuricauda taeanensis]|uniref:PIN domain-containing protein n=1 Tax=Flagellimonas taeanensis TaxID=1005926 RepID=UPI002E7C20F9|nr:PIN domain-containing protein [Allomuricauda taeanensis]MEE1961211.1 PIN domain-containing protein [Allomuricauda taeanensis]
MKVLLDTNIIIHRETSKVIEHDIGQLFNWIDKLHYEKYIHPITISEIESYQDKQVVETFSIKLDSYNRIKHQLPLSEKIQNVSSEFDKNDNDINDTHLLNEIFEDRIDLLITQDKKIHLKAKELRISDKVFKIQSFLEKVTSENPELVQYNVLAVKKADFAEVNLTDNFFDSFREDYSEFDNWFKSKFDKVCYICYSDNNLTAFLYIKVEDETENYSEIKPVFPKKKRLKIGTLKVVSNGYKIGERFLKIVFDNAIQYKVDEIYVTIFDKRPEQGQLIDMLKDWGFVEHGIKTTKNGDEIVLTRSFGKSLPIDIKNPKHSFPFFSRKTRKYIVKIEPQYHTELFPDSINTREDETKYTENEPHRNRIGKVYISHSNDRHLQSGDIIVIYRMGETKPKKYSSTVTSICIVEQVLDGFKSFEEFYNACYRRTMINKEDLEKKWWNKYPKFRPFVIKFLYAHSFPTPKPTLNDLNKIGVIPDIMNMPRGFIEIDNNQFNRLVKFAYNKK